LNGERCLRKNGSRKGNGVSIVSVFIYFYMNTIVSNGVNRSDPHELWEYILTQVELSITPANFNTWFSDSAIVKVEEGIVTIGVPSLFYRDWYLKKFNSLLLKILRGVSYEYRNIEYQIVKDVTRKPIKEVRRTAPTPELPLNDFYINKSDNLNPRYTFDTFVVGSFNDLAFTAAQAALNRPGITYNPLFIYGDTGRGKTHLIQAIGNQYKKLYPSRKVFYLTSEKFGTDYTDSLQSGTANRFKEKYRQYDLLIMDDVQFLSKKEKMQEELFHLFNSLYDNNKQILFSSDRPPVAIPDIADRLRGRLASGMTVDIGEPDVESRVAIVRKKLAVNGIVLAEEAVEYIATSVAGSIRELEGVLNSIVCHTQVKGVSPDLAEVRQSLRSFSRPSKTVSVKHVVSKIAEFYGIEEDSIYEKTRRREVVRPRQVIMYILREDFSVSYPTIGNKLGGRDHTTVIHSCEKVKREIAEDTELAKEISDIRTLLV
jgi:chromosomal replication initiator protein